MGDAAPPAWWPGMPIREDTSIGDLARPMAFGQQDDVYITIAVILADRGCATVADWRTWTKGEFLTMIKAKKDLVLKKHRSSYLAGFESAIGHALGVGSAEDNLLAKTEKKGSGGDMSGMSRKTVSDSFNGSKWQPDPLVYEGVPKMTEMDFIDDDTEKLYLDLLWLCVQVGLCPTAFACTRALAHALMACAQTAHMCARARY
jgi:hypothetical protein